MQPTHITLICVSSNSKHAYYSTESEVLRESELRKDEVGRLYFQLGSNKHYLPKEFQPRTN